MKHITQENVLQAYHIEIADKEAILFYAGVAGTVIEDLELPRAFKVEHEFTPKQFTWCNSIIDYVDIIHGEETSKEDMSLRKLLYCLEDECHFLCDYSTYNNCLVGIVYPERLDFSEERLDFGFCHEETFFDMFSDFVISKR